MVKTTDDPRSLRRAFRNDRMRALYDRARDTGWAAVLDGGGHVRMTSPDGKTVMTLSTTAVAKGRSVLNNEAVFKRWVRLQNAMTKAQHPELFDPAFRPLPPNIEDVIPMQETDVQTPEETAEEQDTTIPAEVLDAPEPAPTYLCADGCGQSVTKEGGYARGHNPNSKAQGGARSHTNGGVRTPATFTIEDVMAVVEYASDGAGIVETRKVRSGLLLIQKMRAS